MYIRRILIVKFAIQLGLFEEEDEVDRCGPNGLV